MVQDHPVDRLGAKQPETCPQCGHVLPEETVWFLPGSDWWVCSELCARERLKKE